VPSEDLGVDSTEVKPCTGYQYLLVLVCTYSGWVEAYPTHTEKAQEVVKCLLREIIPRYGLLLSIRSDEGPAIMAEIVQGLAKVLKIKWKLHIAYRTWSSGKVECMNQTLKITLAKLPRNTILLDRHATIGSAQGTLYP
jgi:transposase InsO family protein